MIYLIGRAEEWAAHSKSCTFRFRLISDVCRFQRQCKAKPFEAGDSESSLCTSDSVQNVQ
jgi:hypothetical protein